MELFFYKGQHYAVKSRTIVEISVTVYIDNCKKISFGARWK